MTEPGMSVFDSFKLNGRVALVTGGSKGLGKVMARAYAEAGADVMICSRHEDECRKAVDEIAAGTGRKVLYAAVDLAQRGEAERLAALTLERLGRVDVLVNNAGSNLPQAIDAITDETWDKIVELNLTSCMALARAVTPGMKERRWGRIIMLSSIMGIASKDGRASYSATKAAVVGLAKAAALDLGPYNITVNAIAPGPFLTDLPGNMLTDEQKATFANRTALGRWGKPAEIAGAALLLGSDAGAYITGSTLLIDGGTLIKTF
jgi:NAD(P)-dependent dehydrogenase (short-subunit alcohol dehydrogenase family)